MKATTYSSAQGRPKHPVSRPGFTLVEILIVVVILGILAAIILPKFSSASATARASMLADDLRTARTQITVFKSQHHDVAPGHPNLDPFQPATEQLFTEHMTQSSTESGATAAPGTAGFRFGPYLRELPSNPVNGKSTVEVINGAMPDNADDSHGWIYQPSTMTFKADSAGADDSGKRYFDY